MKRFATIVACLVLLSGTAALSYDSQVEKANYQLSAQEDNHESLTGISLFEAPEVTIAASPSETPKRATASPLVEGSVREVVASIRGPTDVWSKGQRTEGQRTDYYPTCSS